MTVTLASPPTLSHFCGPTYKAGILVRVFVRVFIGEGECQTGNEGQDSDKKLHIVGY